MRADGTALVETSGADMGQGAWTSLAQIAAEALGVDADKLEFRSGDSKLPDAGIAGGSWHTATAGTALLRAGEATVAKLAALATADPASPLFGAGNAGVIARSGQLHRRDDESRSESYVDILARAGQEALSAEGSGSRDPAALGDRALAAHGAVFAEVKVDPELGQIRVTRMVGAFAAGRIINPKLARSQYLGGMIWGLSFALHEEAVMDPRTGRVLNADLAEYRVPVSADVPSGDDMQVLMIHEDDPYVNPLGVKGVGEIGITGSVAAVTNAIWHATGVRIRRFPARIEDIALASI